VERYHIHSNGQTITVTVPQEPSPTGIDPYHLLIDLELYDNIDEVKVGS
jgi:hypothetical protein